MNKSFVVTQAIDIPEVMLDDLLIQIFLKGYNIKVNDFPYDKYADPAIVIRRIYADSKELVTTIHYWVYGFNSIKSPGVFYANTTFDPIC